MTTCLVRFLKMAKLQFKALWFYRLKILEDRCFLSV